MREMSVGETVNRGNDIVPCDTQDCSRYLIQTKMKNSSEEEIKYVSIDKLKIIFGNILF